MSVLSSGVRVGAAAFAVGLSLAGPQAVGVAAADSASTDAVPVSAGTADPSLGAVQVGATRSQARRSVRSADPSRGIRVAALTPAAASTSASDTVTREPAGVPSSAGTPTQAASASLQNRQVSRPASAIRVGPDNKVVTAVATGSAPRPQVAQPARRPAVAATPVWAAAVASAPAAAVASAPVAVAASVPAEPFGDVVANVGFTIEHFMDTVVNLLAGFPNNPTTASLEGLLWLVRTTVFPAGDGVAVGGSAVCLTSGDCSNQDLTGVDLTNENLTGVNFSGATLTGAILNGATITDSNFGDADLTGATLKKATFTGSTLAYAKLIKADLTQSTLIDTNLDSANLTNATLDSSKLTGVNLSDADLTNASLGGRGVLLDGVTLTDYTLSTVNNWQKVSLRNVDLSGKNLTGLNFTKIAMQNVNLADAVLTKANLTGARLTVDLTGVDLTTAPKIKKDLERLMRGSEGWDQPGRP